MITGEDGRKTVELISAIYKAGCKKEYVHMPICKDDEYYKFEGILKNAIHSTKRKRVLRISKQIQLQLAIIS